MRLKYLVLPAFATALLGLATVAQAPAQISVQIGAAPVCPYGYYDYAPYDCSPYGYYGPDWFANGVFIGAGPWFHGNRGFYGHVDNRYDPQHGYHGPHPERGVSAFNHFQGNEARDGRGHTGQADHAPSGERAGGFQGGGHGGGGDHGGGGEHGGGGHR